MASLLRERFDCVWEFLPFSLRSPRLFHLQIEPQLAQAILDLLLLKLEHPSQAVRNLLRLHLPLVADDYSRHICR